MEILLTLCALAYGVAVIINYHSDTELGDSLFYYFNDSDSKTDRYTRVNKCLGCGLLFSEYVVHTVDKNIIGCPRCCGKKWTQVAAKKNSSGTPLLLNLKRYWVEKGEK